jgi:hypothetical protein
MKNVLYYFEKQNWAKGQTGEFVIIYYLLFISFHLYLIKLNFLATVKLSCAKNYGQIRFLKKIIIIVIYYYYYYY